MTNSQFVPYQFVYFEAIDIEMSNQEEIKLIYCFYDDNTMQKVDVMNALNEAVIFCSNYKIKEFRLKVSTVLHSHGLVKVMKPVDGCLVLNMIRWLKQEGYKCLQMAIDHM